jgi:hypothetical protein
VKRKPRNDASIIQMLITLFLETHCTNDTLRQKNVQKKFIKLEGIEGLWYEQPDIMTKYKRRPGELDDMCLTHFSNLEAKVMLMRLSVKRKLRISLKKVLKLGKVP